MDKVNSEETARCSNCKYCDTAEVEQLDSDSNKLVSFCLIHKVVIDNNGICKQYLQKGESHA